MLKLPIPFNTLKKEDINRKIEKLTNSEKIKLIDLLTEETMNEINKFSITIKRCEDLLKEKDKTTDLDLVLTSKKENEKASHFYNFIIRDFIKPYKGRLGWSKERIENDSAFYICWHTEHTMYAIEYFVSYLHLEIDLVIEFIDELLKRETT